MIARYHFPMALAWPLELGGASAIVITSPRLGPGHSGPPHFRLKDGADRGAGDAGIADRAGRWVLELSASFRRYARRKYCDWKLSPSQKARF